MPPKKAVVVTDSPTRRGNRSINRVFIKHEVDEEHKELIGSQESLPSRPKRSAAARNPYIGANRLQQYQNQIGDVSPNKKQYCPEPGQIEQSDDDDEFEDKASPPRLIRLGGQQRQRSSAVKRGRGRPSRSSGNEEPLIPFDDDEQQLTDDGQIIDLGNEVETYYNQENNGRQVGTETVQLTEPMHHNENNQNNVLGNNSEVIDEEILEVELPSHESEFTQEVDKATNAKPPVFGDRRQRPIVTPRGKPMARRRTPQQTYFILDEDTGQYYRAQKLGEQEALILSNNQTQNNMNSLADQDDQDENQTSSDQPLVIVVNDQHGKPVSIRNYQLLKTMKRTYARMHYPLAALEAAVSDVLDKGNTIKRAAEKFGVPRSTVTRRVQLAETGADKEEQARKNNYTWKWKEGPAPNTINSTPLIRRIVPMSSYYSNADDNDIDTVHEESMIEINEPSATANIKETETWSSAGRWNDVLQATTISATEDDLEMITNNQQSYPTVPPGPPTPSILRRTNAKRVVRL